MKSQILKTKCIISTAAKPSRIVLNLALLPRFLLSVHSFTDPALTPPAQPNVHTPPAPALYWNCSKAVKTASFSHSLHPQRAGLKRTPSHTLTNTHSQLQKKRMKKKKRKKEGWGIRLRILTQVGQSCSGSSKQTSCAPALIVVSQIKFYLRSLTQGEATLQTCGMSGLQDEIMGSRCKKYEKCN